MENASKALIIAGAVLISILTVGVGVAVYNSAKSNGSKEAGDKISSETTNAVGQLELTGDKEVATYQINVTCNGDCYEDSANPKTIKENETVELWFYSNYGSWNDWNGTVSGAEHELWTSGDMDSTYKIIISNPTSDVNIEVEVFPMSGCCFVAETPVLLADGSRKNIEDIKIGDKVLSYNEETQEYEEDVVINTITNPNTTNLAKVILIDGSTIEMNEYHPIYTKEGYKSLTNYNGLKTLTEEDEVLTTNGEFIKILKIEQWIEEKPITSYNLTVEKNHNYFVGETAILVHNAGCR